MSRTMTRRLAAWLLGTALALWSLPPRTVLSSPSVPLGVRTLWLENRALRLGFDARTGALVALTDRASGEALAGTRPGERSELWRLDRLASTDSGVVPNSARGF